MTDAQIRIADKMMFAVAPKDARNPLTVVEIVRSCGIGECAGVVCILLTSQGNRAHHCSCCLEHMPIDARKDADA